MMLLKEIAKKLFGTKQDRDLKKLKPLVDTINSIEPKMKAMTDEELKDQTNKFKKLLEGGKTIEDILPEAFATC